MARRAIYRLLLLAVVLASIACGSTTAPGQTVSGLAASHTYSFIVPDTWVNSGTDLVPIYVLLNGDDGVRLTFGGVGRPSETPTERCEGFAASGWGEAVRLGGVERQGAHGDIVSCQGERPGGVLDARVTLASEPDDVWLFRLEAWGDEAVLADHKPALDEAIRTLEIGTIE